jgi:hypothetical protein
MLTHLTTGCWGMRLRLLHVWILSLVRSIATGPRLSIPASGWRFVNQDKEWNTIESRKDGERSLRDSTLR